MIFMYISVKQKRDIKNTTFLIRSVIKYFSHAVSNSSNFLFYAGKGTLKLYDNNNNKNGCFLTIVFPSYSIHYLLRRKDIYKLD